MLLKGSPPRAHIARASMRQADQVVIVDGNMEPDSGPNDALRKALSLCTGDIIGSCATDEELAAGAVAKAVSLFKDPEIDAITGDARLTDLNGNEIGYHKGGPFDLGAYLHCSYTPYWCSSFFRRSSLPPLDATSESVEFDVWCHLGLHGRIEYVPFPFASYAVHEGQASNNPVHMESHLRGRIKRIRKVADELGVDPSPYIESQKQAFLRHAQAWNLPAERLECL